MSFATALLLASLFRSRRHKVSTELVLNSFRFSRCQPSAMPAFPPDTKKNAASERLFNQNGGQKGIDFALLAAQAHFFLRKTGGTRVPPNAGSRTLAQGFKSRLSSSFTKKRRKGVSFVNGGQKGIRTLGTL